MGKVLYILSAILLWVLSFFIVIQYQSETRYVFITCFGILLSVLLCYSKGILRTILIVVNSLCIIIPIKELLHVLSLSFNKINRPFIWKYIILTVIVCSLVGLYFYSVRKLVKGKANVL